MTAGIALGAVPRGKPVLDRDDWTVRVLLVLLAAFFLVALAIPLWMMISRGFLDSEGRFIGLANSRSTSAPRRCRSPGRAAAPAANDGPFRT